jgi:hypothetical protein
MSSCVYILHCDYSHSEDSERDALHFPFAEDDKITYYFSNPLLYGEELLPKVIYFQANFQVVPYYDFPLTDLSIPVVSTKMLSVLKNVGDFDCLEIPVIMVDDTYLDKKFDENGNLKNDVPSIDSYKAIRLPSLISCFDYDKSEYKPSRSNPKLPSRITRVALKQTNGSFPPIFRVDVVSSEIFISQMAKDELEQSGIKGCVFQEVEVSGEL